MKPTKAFLDTNIILDIICQREAFAEASTILELGIRGELALFCTSLTIANCIYCSRKQLGMDKAKALLKELCRFIHIAPSGQEQINLAFSTTNPDFEDALQYFSAEAIEADVILTRNEKHFIHSAIPVMNCLTFLSQKVNGTQ